jgi:phenylacetate-CoA ligase
MGGSGLEKLARPDLVRLQNGHLAALIATILPDNPFYAHKFAGAGLTAADVRSINDLALLPFTTKAELLENQAQTPPYGTDLTYPLERYSRYHQTSGTSGQPLRWLDTPQSWAWTLDNWDVMCQFAGLRSDDRLFFAFSFGPFLGFWTAFEAAARRGCLCLPAGGMSSSARLHFLLDNRATVVLCTPTYALRLAEVAEEQRIDLATSSVRMLIVAGEPGGSIPATRQRIEAAWGARVIDHWGMTEIGPAAIECAANPGGLHIVESAFLPEVIDPADGRPVEPGTPGELVLTNFGRLGSPLLRYRTGDLVCVDPLPCPCGCCFMRLDGGIRGRVDDMIVIRGNNVYPSALQTILHRFAEVVEYRIEVDRSASLPSLQIDVELSADADAAVTTRIAQAIQTELLFRAQLRAVASGTLPRFEMKAQRVVEKTATC